MDACAWLDLRAIVAGLGGWQKWESTRALRSRLFSRILGNRCCCGCAGHSWRLIAGWPINYLSPRWSRCLSFHIGVEVGAAGGAGADPEVADGEAGDLEGGENLHSMTLNRSNPVEMKMRRNTDLTIALAGNPNAGKTTVFNRLTGSRQHTGNWPGKTIERKSGWYKHASMWIEVVDLPGTYSLAAYSEEEIVARDFLLEGQADVVVVVVDASNLERNLYLVVQILELQIPVLIALNMTDMAETIGFEINSDDLSEGLGGAPVIRMVAARGKGIDELKEEILLYTKQQSIERTPDSIV